MTQIKPSRSPGGAQPRISVVVRTALRSPAHSSSNRRRAQRLAWDWVGAKWPRLQPSLAEMESPHHEITLPGLALSMSARADGSLWTLSVAQAERSGDRTWVTQAMVADGGDADLFAVQTACTELSHEPQVVAPPRLLSLWVERLALDDGGMDVLGEPRTVEDPAQLEAFCAHVLSARRRLPVIVLSNNPRSRYFGVDPRGLAEAVRGLAHVTCVAPQVAAGVARQFGADFAIASGAARIFAPGFALGAAAADHPLLRDSRGRRDEAEPASFRRILCRRICAMSVDSTPDLERLAGALARGGALH